MPGCGMEHSGQGSVGLSRALLPTGLGCRVGPGGHTAPELLLKPLRWEIILLEYQFFSAKFSSSAFPAFALVTWRSQS